jgi:hypothetical protein
MGRTYPTISSVNAQVLDGCRQGWRAVPPNTDLLLADLDSEAACLLRWPPRTPIANNALPQATSQAIVANNLRSQHQSPFAVRILGEELIT